MADGRSPVLGPERLTANIEQLKAQYGPPPWAATLVRNDRYMVTVICQAPGHQNDWHYHLTDEYWSIYEGEICWTLEGRTEAICVRAGEWIMAPANTYHLIEVRGEQPAIRIALLHADEFHRHERSDAPPAPSGARPR